MISASVSLVEAFRWWQDSTLDWQWFLEKYILHPETTPEMEAGTALHDALEHATEGQYQALSARGFTFLFAEDFNHSLDLGRIKECLVSQVYGDLLVRGRSDVLDGNIVRDFKLRIGPLDADKAEGYLDSYQWRFYLDMLGADRFEYKVFEATETEERHVYLVRDLHTITQFRYPELHEDCVKLASRYREAAVNFPELLQEREAA